MCIRDRYKVIIITGGSSNGIVKRFEKLGVQFIYSNIRDKKAQFEQLVSSLSIHSEETLFMGDDLVDYELMKCIGLSACPSDAVPEILAISNYVSHLEGGKGCVRDVIEKVLKLQDNWFTHHS